VDTPSHPSSRPLLFLDIDGVLNRIGPDFPRARPEGGSGAQLHIPEGTRERVLTLSEHFDPVWASAWRGSAHGAMAGPLGIEEHWPHLRYAASKLRALISYAGERRWAWVDDRALIELGKQTVSGCVVVPDSAVGLTDEHVDWLLDFAKSGLVDTSVRQTR
jgi:hypothetical protein